MFTSVADRAIGEKLVMEGDLQYVVNEDLTTLGTESCTEGLAACVHKELTKVVALQKENNETWPAWQVAFCYTFKR